jgi:3-phenylpropionate/cinnamic acid dioxygenase small subunit
MFIGKYKNYLLIKLSNGHGGFSHSAARKPTASARSFTAREFENHVRFPTKMGTEGFHTPQRESPQRQRGASQQESLKIMFDSRQKWARRVFTLRSEKAHSVSEELHSKRV